MSNEFVERKAHEETQVAHVDGDVPPNPLVQHCLFPDEADLDWMEQAVQRSTGGFADWWIANRDKIKGRDWMEIFISIWEGGRGAKVATQEALKGSKETS